VGFEKVVMPTFICPVCGCKAEYRVHHRTKPVGVYCEKHATLKVKILEHLVEKEIENKFKKD